MADIDFGSLVKILQAATDHHDETKPEIVHDLPALANQAQGMGLGGLALQIVSDPSVLAIIFGLVKKLAARITQSREEQRKPVETGTVPPAPSGPEPAPPTQPAPAGAGRLALEIQIEEGWHDWKKTDEDPDGHFDAQAEVNAGHILPPAPVLRFISGDGQHYERGEKRGYDQQWNFVVSTGEKYSFSSAADGSAQPVPGLGHVQFGDHWQESDGRDVIIRFAGFHGDGPRTVRAWVSVGDQVSNSIDIAIAHSKNN